MSVNQKAEKLQPETTTERPVSSWIMANLRRSEGKMGGARDKGNDAAFSKKLKIH